MPGKRNNATCCYPIMSSKQLQDVFRICDPANTGRVPIEYLQDLVRSYAGDEAQEINSIFRKLDRNGSGSLTFRQFSAGIRLIMRQHKECEQTDKHSDSTMAPINSTLMDTHPPPTHNNHRLGAPPEPRFVLSPPESPPRRGIGAVAPLPPPRGLSPLVSSGGSPRRAAVAHPVSDEISSPTDSNGSGSGAGSSSSGSGGGGANKSQCSSMSDADNYECFEGVDAVDADGTDSGISNDRPNSDGVASPLNNGSAIHRHTWLRTSLRRSSPNHQDSLQNRRWGSFRHAGKRQQLSSNSVASHLYRSSSFNSSGRSSTCDTADDMYSDGSLEEDPVLDLNHKVQELQQQMGVFQDSANHNNERYTKTKADNAALQVRVMMQEEQLREAEMRYEERLHEEQRRNKEIVARVDRERQLQAENSAIRVQAAETEAAAAREELQRQRARADKLELERRQLADQVQDLRTELLDCREHEHTQKEIERRLNNDQEMQVQLIEELSREVEKLRTESRTPALPTTSPEQLRLEELHEEMSRLRERNAQLEEANEELQASLLHAGVEQGRKLTAGEHSLAAELEAMSEDQPDARDAESVVKLQQAYKESQDCNFELKAYIDGILLNIVENYPQLLEVKQVKPRAL